jgi:hypothetical protein
MPKAKTNPTTNTPTFDSVPENTFINRSAFVILGVTCLTGIFIMVAALWTLHPSFLAGFISPTIMPWLTVTFTAPVLYFMLGGLMLALGGAATYNLWTAQNGKVRSQKIYWVGQGLMRLSGISVAAFTAGAFVEPVSTLLAPILSPILGPYAILVTLAIFALASCAWYNLYTGDSTVQSTGMLRWWKRQFYTPKAYACQRAIEKFDAAAEKIDLISNNSELATLQLKKAYLLMWRAKEAVLEGSEEVQLDSKELEILQSVFEEEDLLQDKIQKITTTIQDNPDWTSLAHQDTQLRTLLSKIITQTLEPSDLNPDTQILFDILIPSTEAPTRAMQQQREHSSQFHAQQAFLDRFLKPLKKSYTQQNERGIKFLAEGTRTLGLLNAAVANSTGNAFGLIGIALTFPILGLTHIPVFLKGALVAWGLLVGFFAAAALTSNSMVTNAKKLYRSIYRSRDDDAQSQPDPTRTIVTRLTLIFAALTACCLAAFNYQAAALLSLKMSIYLGTGILPIAVSQTLGMIAAAFTVVAAASFFLSFALGKLKPKQKNARLLVQISRYFKEHIFTLKPSKSHIISLFCTSICTFATTTMLFSAITAPAGIIAQIVGAQAAISIGYAMIAPCAYLLLMLFDEGFNVWPFKPDDTKEPVTIKMPPAHPQPQETASWTLTAASAAPTAQQSSEMLAVQTNTDARRGSEQP